MMSSVSSYKNTDVPVVETINDIEQLLFRFGISKINWFITDHTNSYLVFAYEKDNQKLGFKITIPNMDSRDQAFRIVYHKLKALLIDMELGQKVFEVFSNNLIIDMRNGIPLTYGEKQSQLISSGKVTNLYLALKDL